MDHAVLVRVLVTVDAEDSSDAQGEATHAVLRFLQNAGMNVDAVLDAKAVDEHEAIELLASVPDGTLNF